MKFSCLLPVLLLLSVNAPAAEEYLGAQAALAKAAKIAAAAAASSEGGNPADQLISELNAFTVSLPTLEPKAAALQWLAFNNRAASFSIHSVQGDYEKLQKLSFESLVLTLPPPSAWEILRDSVAAENPAEKASSLRALLLRWYFDRLLGNVANLERDYPKIAQAVADLDADRLNAQHLLDPLDKMFFSVSDNGDAILKILEQRLETAARSSSRMDFPRYTPPFEVPDLVTLLGEKRAGAFLVRALSEISGSLAVYDGIETAKLARKIALEELNDLKAPQWRLACSLEAGDLYSALVKKFPPDESNPDFQRARSYELLRQLAAGKIAEAVELALAITKREPSAISFGAQEMTRNPARASAVSQFFYELLSRNPNLPYWQYYIETSVQAGESEKMLALVRSTLAGQISDGARIELTKSFADALLAAGKIEEGIAELEKICVQEKKGGNAPYFRGQDDLETAIRIAQIGRVTQHPEWVEKGLQLCRDKLAAEAKENDERSSQELSAVRFSALLLDLQRGAEAEAVLIEALGEVESQWKTSAENSYFPYAGEAPVLCSLVGVYLAAGRYDDVLTLLEDAPVWGARDLSKILTNICYLGNRRNASLGYCAAKSLARTGKREEAKKIVQALLVTETGKDEVYELLVELEGPRALAELERLHGLDPFEERPVLWKARVLLDAGKLDEAEKAARDAIAIDPSDGEEGPGDRMRVYAILADILKAKSQTKDAEFFLKVVQAIRMSEEADLLYELHLISRAIALYEESLTYFADAYCIQSRLALRLAEHGDWAEAEKHYRRAYELMPDSFGRVESHCFGCERAFAGEEQQTLAERIFTEMAAQRPDNPRVRYLLAYLRIEQGRYRDALPELQKAVELDPDYLNAWKKLADISRKVHLPAGQRNAIAANLLRLDPSQRHISLNLAGVTDLASIWTTLAKIAKGFPKPPDGLLALPASVATLEEMARDPQRKPIYQQLVSRAGPSRRDVAPGAVFAEQDFTRGISALLLYLQQIPQF